MGRLCERPGCSEVAAIAYGFDVDQLLVWLAARDPDGDPLRAGSLCRRHADAMIVPQGWTLDDRRELDSSSVPRRTGGRTRSRRRKTRTKRKAAAEVADGPTRSRGRTWRSRGCPTSTSRTTSTVSSPPAARCWRGRSAARTGHADALMHTTVRLFIEGADAPDAVRPRRHARPLPGVDAARPPGRPAGARRRPARVARRAARPHRAVRPVEAAAHGAHRVRARSLRPLRPRPGRRPRARRVDPRRRPSTRRTAAPR